MEEDYSVDIAVIKEQIKTLGAEVNSSNARLEAKIEKLSAKIDRLSTAYSDAIQRTARLEERYKMYTVSIGILTILANAIAAYIATAVK